MKTNLKNIIIMLLAISPFFTNGQNFMLAKQFGSPVGCTTSGTVLDASGNMYIAGAFDGTVDFDPGSGTMNLSSTGNYDIYLTKLDGSGNFVWAKKFDGTSIDMVTALTIDGSGNIYLTGYQTGTLDFDPGPGTTNFTAAPGMQNLYVCKINPSGNLLWARVCTGSNFANSYSVSVDVAGNVYTTGYFMGTVDFDPGAGVYNLSAGGVSHMFLSKLDASGNFAWSSMIGNGNTTKGTALVVNNFGGQIHVGGAFMGTVDFDPGPGAVNLTSAGSYDIFIALFDQSTGMLFWAKGMGGPGDDQMVDIALCNSSFELYFTASFNLTADCNPGPAVLNLTSAGGRDFIIGYMSSFSGLLYWVNQFGGIQNDVASSICVDNTGDVYATGYFSETVDFDPGAGVFSLSSPGNFNLFIMKIDLFSNFGWVINIGGASSEYPMSVAIDPANNVITSGNFFSPADFDNGPAVFTLTPPVYGVAATYVHKIDQLTPMPVEMLSFGGKAGGTVNELNWETASEKNAAYFTLSKSNDGFHFEELVKVSASGNSTSKQSYDALDASPFNGITYYRLTQTDYDGKENNCGLVAVDNSTESESAGNIIIRPGIINMATPLLININGIVNEEMKVMIHSSNGSNIYQDSFILSLTGMNEITVKNYQLPAAGIYFVTVTSETQSETARVVFN